ncbi:serine protease [Methylobacterium sp. NFXW15]|uniref:serine protease n=1 Tax=Methylobacterium sp. NFXW15 TaxID=2819512 RepID=UPI003CF2E869
MRHAPAAPVYFLFAVLLLPNPSIAGGMLKEFSGIGQIGGAQVNQIIKDLGEKNIIVKDGPNIPVPMKNLGPALPKDVPPTEQTQVKKVQAGSPVAAARDRLSEQFDPRIVGGKLATVNEFPWQVVLIVGGTPKEVRSPFCGGSIIASRWILTAAHCLADIQSPDGVEIVSGSNFPMTIGQGDRVKIEKIISHRQYNSETWENDIALLYLARPIKLGTPVLLPTADIEIPAKSEVTVSGWGAVTMYGGMTTMLLKASMPVVANEVCNSADAYGGAVKAGMLCAGYRDGGVDACQGDSGGPLVGTSPRGKLLLGVVSWGKGCALRLRYGVYTRVPTYITWINEHIKSPKRVSRL